LPCQHTLDDFKSLTAFTPMNFGDDMLRYGLFTDMLLRETGLRIDPERSERLRSLHAAAFNRNSAGIRPLPAAPL
jgi:hypothetical protein